MRARVGLAVLLPAAFLAMGFAGPDPEPADDSTSVEAFSLGLRMVDADRRGESVEVWLDWVQPGIEGRGPITRFERPFRATLGFNIGMPPTLKAVHVWCQDVDRAYDLNPNDLSFKVQIADSRETGTLSFGLPDLRQRRGHPWAVVMADDFCG